MRKLMGWAAVGALVAATGCGGGSTASSPTIVTDEHLGQDEVCTECKVTGGGVIFLDDGQRVTFGLNAIPKEGTVFGGAGTAAEGHIEIQLHDPEFDGTNVFGTVDTIVGCSRNEGVLIGTFQGTLREGGRFEVTVKDAGEPGRADTIEFDPLTAGTALPLVQGGNLQVHELDQCESRPACPVGQCICPDDPTQCEPCKPPSEPPSEPPPPPSEPQPCLPLGSDCTQQNCCSPGFCGDSTCRLPG